jgi:DNA (cytosine-5)-methyltransferase 1
MNRLTHTSLFTGIGGLDLAAEWAGFETVAQCEISDYPVKVLEKHWPDVPRWRDIHDLRADDFFRRTKLRRGGASGLTVLSGGFPCQPHSLAGKREASADERDLWPEYRRVIREIMPRWVVGENVRGILTSENGRFFAGILRDLAELGFNVGWCVFGAVSVGAMHRRERVFIVAHSSSERRQGRHERGRVLSGKLEAQDEKRCSRWPETYFCHKSTIWDKKTTPAYLRADYGASDRMDRIMSIGNAVCPQQALPIFEAIREVEHDF